MTLAEALLLLKTGRKLRLKSWEKGKYIRKHNDHVYLCYSNSDTGNEILKTSLTLDLITELNSNCSFIEEIDETIPLAYLLAGERFTVPHSLTCSNHIRKKCIAVENVAPGKSAYIFQDEPYSIRFLPDNTKVLKVL